jgi:primary-amine oxidase
MDIAGTSNSLVRTRSEQEVAHTVHGLEEDDDWGNTVIQQKIIKEYIENANNALLRYPPNFSGGYLFVNRNVTNACG